jgi:outer membrane protein, heavy metal efflux system
MNRRLAAAALAWTTLSFAQTDPQPNEKKTLDRWVDEARLHHPTATAAHWSVEAARAQIPGTQAWMPPSTQMQAQSDGLVTLSISQMIPGPGKTASQKAVRDVQLEMGRSDSAETLRKLDLSVREAAWMEWMAWEKAKLVARQHVAAVRLRDAVLRNQSAGMATPTEGWLAQVRVRQLKVQGEQLQSEAITATQMRQSLAGAGEDPLVTGSATAPDWGDSTLLAALENRPDLRSMNSDASMQEAMKEAMRKSLVPDFMVGGMLMRMTNGMPGWGVMAGMTLPFAPWSRGMADAEIAGSSARGHERMMRRETMKRMARTEVFDHAARAKAAWNALREIDSTILPGQDRAADDARARYAQGKEMLSMVLSMEEMIRMTQMEAIMRRGEYEMETARLEAAAGLDGKEASR